MYPTFTGSARSKRQVNLSGRNTNPFAAYGSPTPSTTNQISHNAVAHAQQERASREQERRRPPAAKKIQQTWRGHRSRTRIRAEWRQVWDHQEGWATPELKGGRYGTDAECLEQLRLLARFASPTSDDDIQRIHHFAGRYHASSGVISSIPLKAWAHPSFRLAKLLLRVLGAKTLSKLPSQEVDDFLSLLATLTAHSDRLLAFYSDEYYQAVDNAAHYSQALDTIQRAVVAPLTESNPNAKIAYSGFAWNYFSQSHLVGYGEKLEELVDHVSYPLLADALDASLSSKSNVDLVNFNADDSLLWLLSRFIYFHQNPRMGTSWTSDRNAQYVKIISRLISVLADDIGKRIDAIDFRPLSGLAVYEGQAPAPMVNGLPEFVRSQILSLVDQENVTGLLARLEADTSISDVTAVASDEASALASYALTLLRVFPKRRGDIQLWLYRGSAYKQGGTRKRLPATRYFYHAASSTEIFRLIKNDPQKTVSCLTQGNVNDSAPSSLSRAGEDLRNQQWRVILLFLELYTFILQVMDDEEFLSGTSVPDPEASWTKQSALPLDQIEALTHFLKNFAFALNWHAADIAVEQETKSTQSLAAYFGKEDPSRKIVHEDISKRAEEREVGNISGMTLTSVKGLVVGVLRMIYQRDSRRKFLPKDRWLMTQYFEMERFIHSVVEEEEHGRQIEESYEAFEDRDQSHSTYVNDDIDYNHATPLVGTHHVQNLRNMERLRMQQRQAIKRKFLESVTPRLRILENMPFFIPFHTRVQIFRSFVTNDQMHRRGTTDADEWRYAMMNSPTGSISKHRATVRREQIFDDAYRQFYDLGEGLKEPIQIKFVDKFNTEEEGIDGGGVTKEFLTSITNEAFGATDGLESLFIENDQHLLYANPAAVEERKETLRHAGFREGSPDWNETIRDLLRRYEFLGRIIGKCLYEGILVDIHFAPFFLLKWALTGGSSSATKETGYRANLNDLRDLDEGLYQGLLQLKNYPGNVETDFSLNFVVTDTLHLSPAQTKTITRELRPNGEHIPVTNENRLVYIASIARHRLQTQPYPQTSAFLRGLGTVIAPSWLSMFNQSELQTLIGGSGSEISIPDLRANTQYGGLYALGDDGVEHPSIQLFWSVMSSLGTEDVAKVLKFVTSTPRAPLLGFGNLNPRFSIRDSGGDQTRLPSTSTCVNLLKLPVYRDVDVLRERLLYSVNAGAGFNLS